MNVVSRKPASRDVRTIVSNKKTIKRAVKASIKDQKKITQMAQKIRLQNA